MAVYKTPYCRIIFYYYCINIALLFSLIKQSALHIFVKTLLLLHINPCAEFQLF